MLRYVTLIPLQFAIIAAFGLTYLRSAEAVEDWPMWRGDASRSAAVANSLPSEFKLLWKRNLGQRKQAWDDPLNLDLMTYDRVFEPIVVDGVLCVGFNDQDKVVAYDAATGDKRWTFYTEAPVRLPACGADSKVYFCSDDGYLYCVNTSDGSLHWKFRGAPNAQHALGNSRLTSAWPARGGPVLYEDNVYFAASIWPFMGTFLYSLDAKSGEVVWVNDGTGSQYIKQPHSAPSFAGVAPQGAMVATDDLLIVPGGRSVPAVFDRHTGELKYFEINAGGKGTGGSFVTADEFHYYVHTREKGTRAFNLKTGLKTAFTPNEPVLSDGFLYTAEEVDERSVIRAYLADDEQNTERKPIWEVEAGAADELILAENSLVAAAGKTVSIVNLPPKAIDDSTAILTASFDVNALADDESVARMLVANETLFVVGTEGTVAAYGNSSAVKSTRHFPSEVAVAVEEMTTKTQGLLELCNPEGYAFWYGPADSPALWNLAVHSPFVQLAVVDHQAERVLALQKQLDAAGLLGKVTVHHSVAEEFLPPKYVAHSVFVESEVTNNKQSIPAIYECVRPYGGKMIVLGSTTVEISEGDVDRWNAIGLEQALCRLETLGDEVCLLVTREGALPGSADWTHQYGNVANTVKSDDRRVKLPLGILWFGGSSNMDVLPRHGHGPPEQVVSGRLFIQGMNCLSARDVYTGRVLWKREFEDLGTFDVYYDSTYENTPLDPKYNQVHIPGANGRGTNYVVTEDRVYLVVGATCLMIDPQTGEDIGKIELPFNEDGSQSEWGYLGVYDDVLLGGLGFANYKEKYELEFAADAQLKRNRAGFGSKSFDRAASRGLIGFDRHTGELLWRSDAKHSYWHNGIVAGGGRVYCLDKNPTQIEEAMRRRGLSMPDSYRIVCLDPTTGNETWQVNEGIFGTWLGYSKQHDLLLQAGAQASDRLYAEVGQGMRVYQADSGQVHWKKDDLRYAGPCILHNDLIITNANSYSESAGAFYITTGKQRMVKHPLTGEAIPWKMTRAYGCNNIIASENLLTFRSGAAGYYDLTTNSGTGNLGGFKSGCTSNLVVANGVLNAPDYTRTCSCSYQNQTSLALVHMPEVEIWSVNALASAESASEGSTSPSAEVSLDSVGFNFGAAGDRRDDEGVLWLEYPAKAGPSPAFTVAFNDDARVFSHHSASRGSDPEGWITASGIENLKKLSINLSLGEKLDLEDGIGISHAEDDAEETPAGDVDLSSSDLELTEDDGTQTVGLRFASVPLDKESLNKMEQSYIQFTCDKTSTEPTSLWIAGVLEPNTERFSASSNDVTARDRTQAQVTWTPPAWNKPGEASEGQRTPDLSKIVREIASQSDWKSGNPMAFVIGGDGKRVAVSSRGSNKEAAKLVVLGDCNSDDDTASAVFSNYDVELTFAAPLGSDELRKFDVLLQGQLVASGLSLPANSVGTPAPATRMILSDVPIAEALELEFVAKSGSPVLNGIRITKASD